MSTFLSVSIFATPVALIFVTNFASAQSPLPGNFSEVTKSGAPGYCGVNFTYHPFDGNQVDSGGFAIADYDNDGDLDLFIPNGRNFPNALYKNNGNGTFTDVTVAAGLDDAPFSSAGALFLDYENDGDYDLIVGASPGNLAPTPRLFRCFENQGAPNWNFINVISTAGLRIDHSTAKDTISGFLGGMATGDFDVDGHLDLVTTYFQAMNGQDQMRLHKSLPSGLTGTGNSKRFFKDVTKASGLDAAFPGEMWQPTFVDINRDGYPDIHIAMDFDMDLMLMNQMNGTFVDVATPAGLNGSPAETRDEMGVAFADYDNDGDLDMHTTNMAMAMEPGGKVMGMDRFYRNDSMPGSLAFVDIAMVNMTDWSMWGWGDTFFDFDNDADLDHATVSGFKNGPWYNTFHLNEYPALEPDGQTVVMHDRSSDVADFTKIGMTDWRSARGLAAFDYDGDGAVDLAVSCHPNAANPIFGIFKNIQTVINNWIVVELRGDGGSRNVINSWVTLHANGVRQTRCVLAGTSFITQEPDWQHFGLGSSGTIDWVAVRWPDGTVNYQLIPAANQRLTIHKSADQRGDLDGNGTKDCADVIWLQTLMTNPAAYHGALGNYPGEETGDMNGDGFLNAQDVVLLQAQTGC